ncbi:MAG: hypothetical protein LBG12_00575 [Synergistaceae bacterium]|jgi:hypothetical protein|nr:hypothetical protein [Synergistaceae bacterium]
MDMDLGALGAGVFVIVKGYIDTRDEHGKALYGSILGVVSRREIKYLNVMFSRNEFLKTVKWQDLLPMLCNKYQDADRNPGIFHNEEALFKHLQRGFVLNTVAKNHNTKQAEQAISRYCLDSLHLKAVSLIECFDATEEDIAFFEREGGPTGPSSTGGKQEEEPEAVEDAAESAQDAEKNEETPVKEEIVIRCEPVLDPVNGVAANELTIGESVLARMPQDSVFFKLLSRNIANFNGIITSTVTGILLNELGTSNISLALSEGVTGVMKVPGKVKVKIAGKQDDLEKNAARMSLDLPAGFAFGMAAVIIFIFAMAAVYYILG